jgi:predicted ATP-dependent endonuclease of OLD family
MKLIKIEIKGFKGICESKEIRLNDFNVIVGQNDVGKSTILKAIDIFLNNTTPSKDDLNNKTETNEISIIAEFDPRKKLVIIDENIETTFEDEELVNEDQKLVLKKTWDTTKSKITPETFILRKKYNENKIICYTQFF